MCGIEVFRVRDGQITGWRGYFGASPFDAG